MYARKDIVLLDDVLSALDGKTEELVVDRLLGPHGLFRELKSTVILITHASKLSKQGDAYSKLIFKLVISAWRITLWS